VSTRSRDRCTRCLETPHGGRCRDRTYDLRHGQLRTRKPDSRASHAGEQQRRLADAGLALERERSQTLRNQFYEAPEGLQLEVAPQDLVRVPRHRFFA
jgi:hypothetical protein